MRRKVFGQGWALSVFSEGGALTLSIPVDSGSASRCFECAISERDLTVLRSDPLRHQALELILHVRLQRHVGRTSAPDDLRPVIETVLHGRETDLRDQVAATPYGSAIWAQFGAI